MVNRVLQELNTIVLNAREENMKDKRFLLLFIMFALLIIFVSVILVNAADIEKEPRFYVQKDKTSNIKDICYNNGTYCARNSVCLVSVNQRDFSLILNRTMTNTSYPYWNYTLTNSQLNVTGLYQTDVYCCDGTSCDSDSFLFEVTPTGTKLDTAQSIIYILYLIGGVIIFVCLIFGTIKIPLRNTRAEGYLININWLKYLKILFITMAYSTSLLITYALYNIVLGYTDLSPISNLFFYIHRILYVLLIPFLSISVIFCLIKIVMDMNLKKQLERGYKIPE